MSARTHAQFSSHSLTLKPTKVAKKTNRNFFTFSFVFLQLMCHLAALSLSLSHTHTHTHTSTPKLTLIQSAILSCPIPSFWRLSFPHIINFLSVFRFSIVLILEERQERSKPYPKMFDLENRALRIELSYLFNLNSACLTRWTYMIKLCHCGLLCLAI